MSDSSYKSILRSTSLIGGAQLVRILFSVIRSKIIAVIIGPSGVGLIGTFNSTLDFIKKITGLGIDFSAVRDVAKSDNSNDKMELSNIYKSLRTILLLTGLIGSIFTFSFSSFISQFTFETYQYSKAFKILSLVIFINILNDGYKAIIQGLRRIKDLSKITIWTALISTTCSIPLIYYFKENGIVPLIIIVAISQLIVNQWYIKKVQIAKVRLNIKEIFTRSKGMIKLGLAFMGGGIASMGGIYFIRVIIIKNFDIESAGFYMAASAISTLYISLILDAMTKDFYPRLTSVASNNFKSIKIINEQTEIGILLASPGLLFILALTPYLIDLFYSSDFFISYEILRWMILGVFMRVITWPMGYLFVAKGKGSVFFLIQLTVNSVHISLVYIFTSKFGVVGSGIAFFVLYCFHVVFMKVLVSRENGFKWNLSVKRDFALLFIIYVISFVILFNTSKTVGSIVVSIIALAISLYSLKRLMNIFSIRTFKEAYLAIMKKIHFLR